MLGAVTLIWHWYNTVQLHWFPSHRLFLVWKQSIIFKIISIRHMIKTCKSLLDEEGAVVRKKEHTDKRFTWMLVTKPLLGTAADTVLHSFVLWCCTVVELQGLIEGSVASLQSQWVTVLCPLVLLSGWIFKLKHKPAMQLHSVPLGQALTCHICLFYCQALHLLGLILSQAGHCPQSIPASIIVLGR